MHTMIVELAQALILSIDKREFNAVRMLLRRNICYDIYH